MADAPHAWTKVSIAFAIGMSLLTLAIQQCQRRTDQLAAQDESRRHEEQLREQKEATKRAEDLTKRSVEAAEVSAKAAQSSIQLGKDSLTNSQHALQLNERAWIQIQLTEVGSRQSNNMVSFTFESIGRTPAYDVTASGSEDFVRWLSYDEIFRNSSQYGNAGLGLSAKTPLVLAAGSKFVQFMPFGDEIKDAKLIVTYTDLFGKQHKTQCCYQHLPSVANEVYPCRDKSLTFSN